MPPLGLISFLPGLFLLMWLVWECYKTSKTVKTKLSSEEVSRAQFPLFDISFLLVHFLGGGKQNSGLHRKRPEWADGGGQEVIFLPQLN